MATKLTKSVVRESTDTVDGKEIVVTLTGDQEVNLKLKGVRGSEGVTISLSKLYQYLAGATEQAPVEEATPVKVDLKSKPNKATAQKLKKAQLADTKVIVETDKGRLIGVYTTSVPYYNIALVNEKGDITLRRTDKCFISVEKLAKVNKRKHG